jgi:hypothetical protein
MMSVTVPELVGVYWVALGMPVLSVVLRVPIVVVPKVAEDGVGVEVGVGVGLGLGFGVGVEGVGVGDSEGLEVGVGVGVGVGEELVVYIA